MDIRLAQWVKSSKRKKEDKEIHVLCLQYIQCIKVAALEMVQYTHKHTYMYMYMYM